MFFFTYVYKDGKYKLNEYQFSSKQRIRDKKYWIDESMNDVTEEYIGNITDF